MNNIETPSNFERSFDQNLSSFVNSPVSRQRLKPIQLNQKQLMLKLKSPYFQRDSQKNTPKLSPKLSLRQETSFQDLELLKLYKEQSEKKKRNLVVDHTSKWTKFKQ